jgi:primosomal protein N' (replication factor Y) (superfamily II helicase)
VPCVLASPVPTLEALDAGRLLTPSRSDERNGWPLLEIVDRSKDDPRERSLISSALIQHLRSDATVVCVLNTKGRARVLACSTCGELARCTACAAAVIETASGRLLCPRCGAERPVVCTKCGSTSLKRLRPGTARLREELAAAAAAEVVEITSDSGAVPRDARIFVGTEAVLHQVERADVVAFLDIDAELLAPRYRAEEETMVLLARGARLVGGRAGGGRLLVQTRLPRHDVLQAVLLADPGRLVANERARRAALGFPPAVALAAVSGPAAESFVDALRVEAVRRGVEVMGPADGVWLVRAAAHETLCDTLAAVPRPPGRLRLEVDPLRL